VLYVRVHFEAEKRGEKGRKGGEKKKSNRTDSRKLHEINVRLRPWSEDPCCSTGSPYHSITVGLDQKAL